ncbi:MAG: DNA-deoxyinosine glycosylase [Clostridia bacterium]|nr:DNA-deoxyinosine glycosylase [Clostridia bacterium]
MARFEGLAPVYTANSRVLILGSFPSVKSRAVGFYYGNPQNRFWKTVCGYFGEDVPPSIEGKTEFLHRRKIALWDVVASCEIAGSADSAIREEKLADLNWLYKECGAPVILCNGGKSYGVIEKNYPELLEIAKKLPSTSPANPRFTKEEWHGALREAGL